MSSSALYLKASALNLIMLRSKKKMNQIRFLAIFFSVFVIGCSTETDKQVVVVDSVDGITMPESAAVMQDGGIIISLKSENLVKMVMAK